MGSEINLLSLFLTMYTRDEASRARQEFWTTFGKYMGPIPSAEGMRINWINYHTQVKDVYFRMYADSKQASIAISIEHSDAEIRDLFFEQFLELQLMLKEQLQEEWVWNRSATGDGGRPVSRIEKIISNVSIFSKDDWPDLISFFKPRIIALDAFWESARYSFDMLK